METAQDPKVDDGVNPDIDQNALTLVEETSLTLLERVKQLSVTDETSFHRSDSLYDQLLAQEKAINALFDPIRTERYKAYLRIQQLQKERVDELAEGKVTCRKKGKDWLNEQERLRDEAERTAREDRARAEREARESAAKLQEQA